MQINKEKLIPYIERMNSLILDNELHPNDAFQIVTDENLVSKTPLSDKELMRVYNKSAFYCSNKISNQFRDGTLDRNQKERINRKQIVKTDRKLLYSQRLSFENKVDIEATKLYYANKNISVLFFELCKKFNIDPTATTELRYQILIKTLNKLRKG